MTSNVLKADVYFGVKTDHSMISLEIKILEIKEGLNSGNLIRYLRTIRL